MAASIFPPFPANQLYPGLGNSYGIDGGAVSGISEILANSIDSGSLAAGAIGPSQISATLIQQASVSLTAANIKAMEATPVTLLPAPGAGKSYILFQVNFRMTATATAFANGGAVVVQYHTGAVAATGTVAASVVNAGSAGTTDNPMSIVGASVAQNSALEITNATAPFITGTGTAIVQLWYAII